MGSKQEKKKKAENLNSTVILKKEENCFYLVSDCHMFPKFSYYFNIF